VTTYNVALIPGDGIGPEVLREGKKVMDAVAQVAGITWKWTEYPFGAEHWLKHRKGLPTLMSEEDMAGLGKHDAVYFGAVGIRGSRSPWSKPAPCSGCGSTSTSTSTSDPPSSCVAWPHHSR